jgi:uncharacterized membrane protein
MEAFRERINYVHLALLALVLAACAVNLFIGLAVSIVVYVYARRSGWVLVSRICLVIAVLIAVFLGWALVNGVGIHAVTSSGSSAPIPLN